MVVVLTISSMAHAYVEIVSLQVKGDIVPHAFGIVAHTIGVAVKAHTVNEVGL